MIDGAGHSAERSTGVIWVPMGMLTTSHGLVGLMARRMSRREIKCHRRPCAPSLADLSCHIYRQQRGVSPVTFLVSTSLPVRSFPFVPFHHTPFRRAPPSR